MNIKQIKLKNFLSHVDTTLKLDEDLPYLFTGENGAGKSSLVKDSITWGLFAEARAKGAGDELIYNGEKSCKVEIVFEVNNEKYVVNRVRERNKKTELSLFRFDENILKDISNVTMSKTQEDLEKILGFNYMIFSVSACLEQNSKLNFSDLTPKECKDTIMRILNIDKFNDYERIVRDKISTLEVENRLEAEAIERSKEKISSYSESKDILKKLVELKEDLEKKKKEETSTHETKQKDIEDYIKVLQDEIEKNQKRVEELRTAYKIREIRVMEIGNELTLTGSEVGKAQQRILKIKTLGSKCPTCESELKEDHVHGILKQYENELNTNKKLQEDKKPEFDRIRKEMEDIEKEGKSLGVLEKQEELKTYTKALKDCMDKKSSILTALQTDISELDKKISKFETEVLNSEELLNDISKRAYKIVTTENEIANYRVLQDAFGKRGIPAMIISNITNELEFNINNILRELTSKNISVKVATEKNLKSKDELSDTLEIIVRNGLFERPYNLYSGGEKYRIDLAIRLALSKILSNRNNFKLETLIIDEPSGLDRQGLQNFKETISNLSKLFKKILVISHLTELVEDTQDKFRSVKVRSDNGVSFVNGT